MERQYPLEQDPQHRHHGPHRCRQDHDHRADPLLHRPVLQDRRGARGHRHHGLDGPGAGARHHHHLGRHHLLLARLPRSTSSTRRATSTSPSRWSARCACSTARSRSSTRWPASSPRRRRCGGRPTSTGCRASSSSTRWTASAPTSTARLDMIRSRLGAHPGGHPAADRARGRASAGVIDLIEEIALRLAEDDDDARARSSSACEIPADVRGPGAASTASKMIEALAEVDEQLMEKYLDGKKLEPAELKAAVRRPAPSP